LKQQKIKQQKGVIQQQQQQKQKERNVFTNNKKKKPRYLNKLRRLSTSIETMSGTVDTLSFNTNTKVPESSPPPASSMKTVSPPQQSNGDFTLANQRNITSLSIPKPRQKPPSFSSPSSATGSSISSVGTAPKDDDSSVMHISCTVASEEAANVQTRHSRSRGTLVCVECGMRFSNIKSLQQHIQNKTVWTNRSLLGCRVSVMWAHNQWYEGTVTQYDVVHGRHCVVYDDGEQKWYHMANKTFYVVSQKEEHSDSGSSSSGDENSSSNSATKKPENETELEFKQYEEPLSKEYLLAQSVVHACFGNATQQVGYRTDGHLCVTEQDRIIAHDTGSSLLYGEVLPRGCNKILDSEHLDAASCTSLYDLGMGTGKFVLQAYIQFSNLLKVVGVELAYSRFVLSEKAALTLVKEWPDEYTLVKRVPNQSIVVSTVNAAGEERILEFRRGNLFAATDCHDADIVIAQTNFPSETQIKLCRFLGCMKPSCKILTYLNLLPLWKRAPLMFRQLDINRSLNDRFATSWSMHRGCHFFLWERVDHNYFEGQKTQDDENGKPANDVTGCCFRLFSSDNARVHNSGDRARQHPVNIPSRVN